METTMLSKFLYCASVLAVLVSFAQWMIRVQDPSQLMFGLNIALAILICAYMHTAFRNVVNDAKKIDEKLDKEIKAVNKALDVAINYTREVEAKIDKPVVI